MAAVTYLLLIGHDPTAPSLGDPKNTDKDAIEDFKRQLPTLELREHRSQSWLMVQKQADGTLRHREQYFTNQDYRVALFDFDLMHTVDS